MRTTVNAEDIKQQIDYRAFAQEMITYRKGRNEAPKSGRRVTRPGEGHRLRCPAKQR